ncbi:MAG: fibronectin type III domain-containing protein, partial [Calditrichaceae bacterium]|nr:fibronectin type III domain-containing protein [Calditrichaceae bacterium]
MKFLIILASTLILLQCDFDYDNPVDPDFNLTHPGRLALAQDGEWIRLDWNANDHYTTGYQIQRKSVDEEWIKLIDIKNTNQLTYVDTTCYTNVLYSYRICGLADDNKSKFSNEPLMKVDFPAPYQIKGTAQSENSMRLSWDDSCTFEDGYKIFRKSENETEYTYIGNVNSYSSNYIDEGLNYNKVYLYYLIGYTEHNESLKSAEYNAMIKV